MRNCHRLPTVVLALVVVLATMASAAAQNFPALSGRVVDGADIIHASMRTSLTEKLAALEAKTTDQLVVVTVKSLDGRTVEDYANRLFREWKLGQRDKNNGVLLLVAPTERKVRIEVGYGLEGALTDAVTKLIIEGAILPEFRANNIPRGIVRGVDDVIQVLTGDAAEWQRRASDMQTNEDWPAWLIMLIVLLFLLPTFYAFYKELFGPRPANSGRGSSSGDSSSSSSSSSWSSGSSWGSSSGGFSGGGGSSGGGGASGSW